MLSLGCSGFDDATVDLLSASGSSSGEGEFTLVSAVPIPQALWLFGSGLISLIGLAGRKA